MCGLTSSSLSKTFDELSKEILPSTETLRAVGRDQQIKLTTNGFRQLLVRMLEEDLYEAKLMIPVSQLRTFSPKIREEFDLVFTEMLKKLKGLNLTKNRIALIVSFGSVVNKRDELLELFYELNQNANKVSFAEGVYSAVKMDLLEKKKFKTCSKFTKSADVEFNKIVGFYNKRVKEEKQRRMPNHKCNTECGCTPKMTDEAIEKRLLTDSTRELFRVLSIYDNTGRKDDSLQLRKLFIDKFGEESIKEQERIEKILSTPVKIDTNCIVDFRPVADKSSHMTESVHFKDKGKQTLNLFKTITVSNREIKSAVATPATWNDSYLIALRFTKQGALKFGKMTEKMVGKRIAIVINGEIYSAPIVNEPIYGGSAQITGSFSLKEARNLAASINANCGEKFKEPKK